MVIAKAEKDGEGVPDGVGPEIVRHAPARGRLLAWDPVQVLPDGASGFKVVDGGYRGRRGARIEDVFDRMAAQALRAGREAPFTPAQVGVARAYRTLHERHQAAGVRCSSIEALGGSGGGSFIDAVLADGEQLALWHRRIGDGAAIVVRRVRPSSRGSRRNIPDRALVDGVCLHDQTLAEVLAAYGWSVKGVTRKAAQQALAAALDRMAGPVGGVV